MAIVVTLYAGDKPVDQGVGYTVWGASFSNLGAQWLWLGGNRFAAPNSRGTFYIDGDTQVHVEWKAPPNTDQPPAATSQFGTVTFSPVPLWDSGTASAPKGLYYDRNPTSITKANSGGTLRSANSGTNVEWTYTVPAGRKAYVEAAYAMVQITVAYANDAAVLQSAVNVAPLGGTGAAIALSLIYIGTLKQTIAVGLLGGSMQLQATDVLTGVSSDTRAAGAGTSIHYVTAKITEFDA